jgi:hypothetical protein
MRSQLKIRSVAIGLALACFLLTLTSCHTLQYREVQRDFEEAVRLDNQGAGSPFTELHSNVVAELTPDFIAKLDAKLRPNAWMLRAVSAWRSGNLAVATESAQRGQKESTLQKSSRDAVILELVPGLVVDSEIKTKWIAAGKAMNGTLYEEFERDFKTAHREFKEAQNEIGPATPESVVSYVHFQKWRFLENWRHLVSWIIKGDEREAAQARGEVFLGKSFKDAANAERDAIPEGHPLRQLIRAQGGG